MSVGGLIYAADTRTPFTVTWVDLEVDGTYYATDTLRPYTFDLDASLSGSTLVARDYAMPDSRVGTSDPV